MSCVVMFLHMCTMCLDDVMFLHMCIMCPDDVYSF